MAQRKRRKGIARSAGKKTTNEVIENCKFLRDNPDALIPECKGNCKRCKFEIYRKQISHVRKFLDDPNKLKKFSSRGLQLVRSYAVSMYILGERNISMMANFHTHIGELPYIMRGKVKKEFLAGLQHFNDPSARLLAYFSIAKKLKINLFSADKLYCNQPGDKVPDVFTDFILKRFKHIKNKEGDTYTCQHLKGGNAGNLDAVPHIVFDWKSAGIKLAMCETCSKDKMNIYKEITDHSVITGDDWFSVYGVYRPQCHEVCDVCPFETGETDDMPDLVNRYKRMDIGESEFLEEWIEAKKNNLDTRIFINGNVCYGTDADAYIDALSPSPVERKALSSLFKKISGPIIETNASANKILSSYWDEFGDEILSDLNFGRDVIMEAKQVMDGDNVSELLSRMDSIVKRVSALADYPVYNGLESVPEFIDTIAREYRYLDMDEIIRNIDRNVKVNADLKVIGLSFLLVMDRGENRKWQYTSHEYERGKYLERYARKLLECHSDEYDESFREFLNAYGYDIRKIW